MKKKILLFFMMLSIGYVGSAQNLISNGDFETGDNTSWGGVKNLSVQTETVYSGTYSAEISGEAYFSQTPSPSVSAGKTYRFTCYAKANVPGDNAYMAAQYRPGGGAYQYFNYVNIAASGWTEFSFVVHLTAYELTSFRLGFYKLSGGSAQHIDNIKVEEIDASSLASDKDIVSTTVGDLDVTNRVITNIIKGSVTAKELLDALTLSTNANAIISPSDGKYTNPNTVITDGHTIRVFAENGTFQNYTIETSNKTIKSIVNGDEAELDNTNYIISKITPVLTVEEFKNIIELYDGATLEVLNIANNSVVENQSTTVISESMVARVSGSNGAQDYTLQLRDIETDDTIKSIGIGSIDQSTSAIENMINGMTALQLRDEITVAAYATFEITDNNGVELASSDIVTNVNQIRVTAENGSLRIYGISFGSSSIQNITYTDEDVVETELSNQNVTLEGDSELKITNNSDAITLSSVNINSEDSWLLFENIKPSIVRDNYLKFILAYGQPAVLGQNVRIVQYVHGAVVIPHAPNFEAVEIFDGENLSGNSLKLIPYAYNKELQLDALNDNIASFKVKRGYYLTLAENEDGTGYSKVFIAHDDDLVVNTMPLGLENKVSFARVIPWRWPMKKGHPSHGQNPNLNIGWTYNWDAAANSSIDIEFVPIKQNLNWPGYGNFTNKRGSTHMLGPNEPDRPDQANASVDQVLRIWPRLMESGLRIGSPAPADSGLWWLYEFIDKADDLNYRVDFVAIHWYRGCQSAENFYNFARAVHERTGRPIWITEWNNGANWTSCKPQSQAENAEKVKAFIERISSAPFVERYCIFPYLGTNWSTVGGNGLSATGIVYRDNVSPMAFNPDEQYNGAFRRLTTPTNLVATFNNNDSSIDLTWDDVSEYENGVKVERRINGGSWVEIARIEEADQSSYKDTDTGVFGNYDYRIRQMIVGVGNSPYSNVDSETVILEGDENIARGKTTTTSTDRASSGYDGSKAVDGDIIANANRWLSASGASYPHWMEIDLDGTFEISALKLYTGYNGYGSPINDFKFQYWDGTTWLDALDVTGNTSGQYTSGFTRVTTTRVRLHVTRTTDDTVKLFEIEVYGKSVTLSLDDQFLEDKISIYPNPVKGSSLYIKGASFIKEIQVYNLIGMEMDVEYNEGVLDTKSLKAGVYIVKINNKLNLKFLKI